MAYNTSGQEFQHISDILKEWLAPAIVNQVYLLAPFWAQVKKSKAGVYGKRLVIPVRYALTEAVGSKVANNYALPTAGRTKYDQAYITIKRLYGRIQIDGFAIESSKGKGGWIDALTGETRSVADAFGIEIDRQSMGRGTSILGDVLSVSGSTITVDNPHGITELTPPFMWFREGMVIDGHDCADGTSTKHVDSLTISSISGNVLTMSASTGIANLAAGDWLVREDSFKAASGVVSDDVGDMMGLDGIIGTDNPTGTLFQGIARNTNAWWQSTIATSQGVLTELKIQEILDSISKKSDGSAPNLMLTTHTLRNKLMDIVKADRVVDTLKLVAGWEAIRYRGGSVDLPVMVHKNCPTGYIYFISLPHIKYYSLADLVWDNKGGGIIKPVADYDAYEAWFKLYGNMGTDMPASMGKGSGFTVA